MCYIYTFQVINEYLISVNMPSYIKIFIYEKLKKKLIRVVCLDNFLQLEKFIPSRH